MAAEASRGPGDRPPALCFLRGPSWDLSEGSTCPWLFLPAPECQQPDPSMAPLESGSAPPPAKCSGWVVMGALAVPLSQQTHSQEQWVPSPDSEPRPELNDHLNFDSNSI